MNITKAILELITKYGLTPFDINDGNCDSFANDITDMGFGQAIWGDDLDMDLWSLDVQHIDDWLGCFGAGHCFIWYNGKFYDSECPQGCDYPDYLPIYQRNIKYFCC